MAREEKREGGLERVGLALAEWSEKWFPDALVFALMGIVIVFIIGLLLGESPVNLAVEGGKSFWVLVPFTMQMAMVIIGGYVVASSPPVHKLIRALSGIPKTGRGAVAFVAAFSMIASLLSWGFSLIFSGLLVRELTKRVKGLDYRAAGSAAYLGLGAVWALGLSSSAALMMATKSAIPQKLFAISGIIPLTQTLFIWPTLLTAIALITISIAIAYWSAPSLERAKTAEDFGIEFEPMDLSLEPRKKPGEWLEYSPILTVLVVALLGWYLFDVFRKSPVDPLAALDLNNYNLIFIACGMLLHWRPRRFIRAVTQSVPATGGVLIQFPILRRYFWHDCRNGHHQVAGSTVCFHLFPGNLSAAGGSLLVNSGCLYPFRRQQMGYRSALRFAGCRSAAGQYGMGGTDLQCSRSIAESLKPVLDAAAAGHAAHEGT